MCVEKNALLRVCHISIARRYSYGHFEFTSPHEPRRRIIISETGYRSHFSPMFEIEEAPGLEAYAHALALGILRQKPAPAWDGEEEGEEPAQLGLF